MALDALFDDPKQQGLLALGLGLLNSRGSFGQALGQAGQQSMGVMQQAREQQRLRGMQDIQQQMAQMQLENAKREAAKQVRLDALRGQFVRSPAQQALSGGGGPTVANAGKLETAQPGYDFAGFADALASEDPAAALAMKASLRKEQPKLSKLEPMRDPATGQLVNVAVYEDGTPKVLPFGVKPDMVLQNLGNRVVSLDKNALPSGQSFALGVSPDAQLGANVTMRGQNIGAATAAAGREQADRHHRDNMGRGTWDSERGVWVTPGGGVTPAIGPDNKPLGTKPKPLPEHYAKSMTGVNELYTALDNYEKAIKDAGGPNAAATGETRAKLRASYTALLMATKTAMELGALAGPDMDVLGGMLADPTSFKGAMLMSKGGITEQIARAREYVSNREQSITGTYNIPNPMKRPANATQERKTVAGKNYVKVGNEWFEEAQ